MKNDNTENVYLENVNLLNNMFTDKFGEAYRSIKKRGKSKIIKYISSVYRRWYYSGLIDDTILSPANIFCLINKENDMPSLTYPVIYPLGSDMRSGFGFDIREYTLDNHPVITDLKRFLELCSPDIELDENDNIKADIYDKIIKSLSLYDPFYAEYLFVLSVNMKLIEKFPAIYSNRAKVTKEFEKLFKQSNKKIFEKIVNETINLSAMYIGGSLLMPKGHFGKSFVERMLKRPMTTDEIFKDIYLSIGISLEDILAQDAMEDFDDDDAHDTIMSSMFFMGIMIDKFLFTPFGYYLKLIQPLYSISYDFDNELDYIVNAPNDEDGLLSSMFAPCSAYSLTELGLKFFNVAEDVTKENESTLIYNRIDMPYKKLLEVVKYNSGLEKADAEFKKFVSVETDDCDTVAEFKVRYFNDKQLWKNIEVPLNYTLHDFFIELSLSFFMNEDTDYSFFTDLSENRFSEYKSPVNPKRRKKAEEITFETLNFPAGHKFVLSIFNSFDPLAGSGRDNYIMSRAIKFEIELLKFKERSSDVLYPQVTRTSRALRDKEFELEMF